MPVATLNVPGRRAEIAAPMPTDGGNCETVLTKFPKAGIDPHALAAQLQPEGTASFIKSWFEPMGNIVSKDAAHSGRLYLWKPTEDES